MLADNYLVDYFVICLTIVEKVSWYLWNVFLSDVGYLQYFSLNVNQAIVRNSKNIEPWDIDNGILLDR